MKKIIFCMFIISNLIFANWETIELEDEFRDKIGKVAIFSYFQNSQEGIIKIFQTLEHEELIVIYLDYYPSEKDEYKASKIRVKIDLNSPLSLKGFATENSDYVEIYKSDQKKEFNSLIEQMKKGNKVKILIYKDDDTTIFRSASLKEFTKNYNKIK